MAIDVGQDNLAAVLVGAMTPSAKVLGFTCFTLKRKKRRKYGGGMGKFSVQKNYSLGPPECFRS